MELEEETDPATFEHLWLLTEGRRVRKRRHVIPDGDRYWEVDEFLDRDLVLAEMEIPTIDTEITVPDWLRPVLVRDVTGERKYTNRSLAR
jgi:CYTH domain-containing protein